MKEKIFKCSATQARLEIGPFEPYLDKFIFQMRDEGFPQKYIKLCFRVIIRFSDWIGLNKVALRKVTTSRLNEFWEYHGALREHKDYRLLSHFIQFLRNEKVIPKEKRPRITCPNEKLLFEFGNYLRDEKGLSETYIYQQLRNAKSFLDDAFPMAKSRWDLVNMKIIGDYVSRKMRKSGPSEAKSAAGNLAQFFKFLFIKGKTKEDLSKIVPRPACWKHSRLPIFLEKNKVNRLLESCDEDTEVGSRDFAILKILSTLGLRSCEVKNLDLDDIDWKKSTMRIHGKGQESTMPMPKEVGKAIAQYLKNHRPQSKSRSLFLTTRAPYKGFATSAGVSGIVRFALKRAGIDSDHKGGYLLRHTVANRILNNGGSLYEVGQQLRHTQLGTSAIYAKADFKRMSLVVGQWVGGEK